MLYPRARIIIFAKAPVPGTCKTRLGKDIGYPRAARVYRALLTQNIKSAVSANLAPVFLYCAPDTRHAFFFHCRRQWQLRLRRQSRGNLGQRMHAALKQSLREADYALIIGGDCPVLGPVQLRAALTALNDGMDCVFAPTEDGGYALVGMRLAHRRVFQNIAWSSSSVMQQTQLRLQRLGVRWACLPTVWDVDERADYIRAKNAGLLDDQH